MKYKQQSVMISKTSTTPSSAFSKTPIEQCPLSEDKPMINSEITNSIYPKYILIYRHAHHFLMI